MSSKALERIKAQGFDRSASWGERWPGGASRDYVAVGCSQCAATVINGVACHETGCPNEVHECRGCSNLVPRGVKYCAECQ